MIDSPIPLDGAIARFLLRVLDRFAAVVADPSARRAALDGLGLDDAAREQLEAFVSALAPDVAKLSDELPKLVGELESSDPNLISLIAPARDLWRLVAALVAHAPTAAGLANGDALGQILTAALDVGLREGSAALWAAVASTGFVEPEANRPDDAGEVRRSGLRDRPVARRRRRQRRAGARRCQRAETVWRDVAAGDRAQAGRHRARDPALHPADRRPDAKDGIFTGAGVKTQPYAYNFDYAERCLFESLHYPPTPLFYSVGWSLRPRGVPYQVARSGAKVVTEFPVAHGKDSIGFGLLANMEQSGRILEELPAFMSWRAGVATAPTSLGNTAIATYSSANYGLAAWLANTKNLKSSFLATTVKAVYLLDPPDVASTVQAALGWARSPRTDKRIRLYTATRSRHTRRSSARNPRPLPSSSAPPTSDAPPQRSRRAAGSNG